MFSRNPFCLSASRVVAKAFPGHCLFLQKQELKLPDKSWTFLFGRNILLHGAPFRVMVARLNNSMSYIHMLSCSRVKAMPWCVPLWEASTDQRLGVLHHLCVREGLLGKGYLKLVIWTSWDCSYRLQYFFYINSFEFFLTSCKEEPCMIEGSLSGGAQLRHGIL